MMGELHKAWTRDAVMDRVGLLPSGRVRRLEDHAHATDRVLTHDWRRYRGVMYSHGAGQEPFSSVTVDYRGFTAEHSVDDTIDLSRLPDSHHHTINRVVDCTKMCVDGVPCFPVCTSVTVPCTAVKCTVSGVDSGSFNSAAYDPCTGLSGVMEGTIDLPAPGFQTLRFDDAGALSETASGGPAPSEAPAAARDVPCAGCKKQKQVKLAGGGATMAALFAIAAPMAGLQLPTSVHDVLMLVAAALGGAFLMTRVQATDGEASISTTACCYCCPSVPTICPGEPVGYLKQCKIVSGTKVCVAVPYYTCNDATCDTAGQSVVCTPCT